MAKLFIQVTSISLPDPFDQIAMEGNVRLEDSGPGGGYSWFAYADVGAPQNDIKAAAVDAASTVATANSLSYSGSIIAGWPDEYDDDDSGLCSVPGASSTVSLAASTPRQPSTTRPVMVMVTGSWSWNLTALGTQTGSLSFQSDSSATPSTAIWAPAWSRGITVGITVGDTGTMPVCFSYIVPVGHYYQVVATGGATFSIREQVL